MPSYWAFLSYSDRDRVAAQRLQLALEAYRVPRRLVGRTTPAGRAPPRFRPIFRDRSELAVEADLGARIDDALVNSAYLIVLCSPAAAASRWVAAEITRFRALHGQERILTVIVGGSPSRPGTAGGSEDCFPAVLGYGSDYEQSEVLSSPQPISADMRPGGDGRRLVRLKLVAGMLGVGLDELVRRDDQRRQQQFGAFAAASLLTVTAMGVLAAAALVSRNQAIAARNQANSQRAQAEKLVEFMLGDLRKRVEPSGRLDLMDGVAQHALAYYDAQRPGDLDDRSLDRRARALSLLGEISVRRGQLNEALSAFEQAAATTAEVLSRSPKDATRIFDHAQSVYWVGDIAWQRGQISKAEGAFQEYRRLAEHLVAIDPNNDDWQAEVDYAHSDLGTLRLDQGQTTAAITEFRRSLDVSAALAGKRPEDTARQIDLGGCHAWLSQAFEQEGDLAQARAERITELDIYQAVLKRDPTEEPATFSAVVARRALARFAYLSHDLKTALLGYEDAARRAERLAAQEPGDMATIGAAAIVTADLGETFLALGRLDAAESAQRRAETLITATLAHDTTVRLWSGYRTQIRLLNAELLAKRGRYTEALALDTEILGELAPSRAPTNTETRWLIARTQLALGDDLSALHHNLDAREHWKTLLAANPIPAQIAEPRLSQVLIAAQSRLDHDQRRARLRRS